MKRSSQVSSVRFGRADATKREKHKTQEATVRLGLQITRRRGWYGFALGDVHIVAAVFLKVTRTFLSYQCEGAEWTIFPISRLFDLGGTELGQGGICPVSELWYPEDNE